MIDTNDVNELKAIAEGLWKLLDDIDTLDDACRSNDESFRNLTRDVQRKRHGYLICLDSYSLELPKKTGKATGVAMEEVMPDKPHPVKGG